MRLVIDSNEYIFAFGPFKDPVIRALFDELIDKPELHLIRSRQKDFPFKVINSENCLKILSK